MRYSYIFLIAWLILTTGCTRRELLEKEHAHFDDGYLRISLKWNGYTKPRYTQYFFYNKDGSDPIRREGDTNGFEGYIPAGTYNIVICNTALEGAELNSALGYDRDYVCAQALNEEGLISQVNHIFGTGLGDVVVPQGKIVEKTAEPYSLVKKLTILLQANTPKTVKGMSVNLCGAVKQKRLVDHVMSEETASVKSNAVYDDKTNRFQCPISTLGYRSSCLLHLDATYEDNEKLDIPALDLSEVLNDFPEDEKTIVFFIQLSDREEIKVTVQIHSWVSGGGSDIIIE